LLVAQKAKPLAWEGRPDGLDGLDDEIPLFTLLKNRNKNNKDLEI
jgi:hypothetical protein